MSSGRVDLTQLASEVMKTLDGYSAAIYTEVTETSVNETAKEAVRMLKSNSPRDTGDYAKDWAATRSGWSGSKAYHMVVYNREHYRLIHLLEKGHRLVRNGKEVGKVNPQEHVDPVEQKVKTMLEDKIRSKIQNMRF